MRIYADKNICVTLRNLRENVNVTRYLAELADFRRLRNSVFIRQIRVIRVL